jgi:surface antigen
MRKFTAAAAVAATIAMSGFASAPATAQPYWQCVTFARFFSGIQIFGDAWTWWQSATSNKYRTGSVPEAGAVLVFKKTGVMQRGHVAVVSQVLTDRIVQITHANWSPINGRRGQVEKDVTMIDVSDAGDWSSVKVWYGPITDIGGKVYPTYGFIYKDKLDTPNQAYAAVGPAEAGKGVSN